MSVTTASDFTWMVKQNLLPGAGSDYTELLSANPVRWHRELVSVIEAIDAELRTVNDLLEANRDADESEELSRRRRRLVAKKARVTTRLREVREVRATAWARERGASSELRCPHCQEPIKVLVTPERA